MAGIYYCSCFTVIASWCSALSMVKDLYLLLLQNFLQAKQIIKELVCVVSAAIKAQTFPYNRGLLRQRFVVSGCRCLQAVARLREQFLIPLRGCVREENKVLQMMACASAQPLQEETLNCELVTALLPAGADNQVLWLEMGRRSKLNLRASQML